ncbi:unnamed protein product [Kuraishia capsulata CBS 1993]|uniref:Vacuolar membrane-associated protein IML1 n=1 Tax=Kuraishia capsulata CBS 1993 TaxID=1382522 RepID=W6MVI6_9ASCO|nr:uncharacterized protein KUCA_T00005982001 [Kuraishia capsulata CBS 1993]CDK29987.1 unnamed protein product [Kuraishia capsulata CBS 1993]
MDTAEWDIYFTQDLIFLTRAVSGFQALMNSDFDRNRVSLRANEASLIVGKRGGAGPAKHTFITSPSRTTQAEHHLPFAIGHNNAKGVTPDPTDSLIDDNVFLEDTDIGYIDPLQVSVKFHELRTSSDDVVFDSSLISGPKKGYVGELQCLEGSTKKLNFILKEKPQSANSVGTGTAANINTNNTVSILSGPLQALLNLKIRSPALIRLRKKEDVQADVVEIFIKDLYLSRGDMWSISSFLVGTCLYKSQKVSFIDSSIRGTIGGLYRNGRKVFSCYVGEDTKVVFRSESSRLIFFIQISSEMWHFEESGQQMFYKLMNSLFPKIFKRWKEMGTHHLITIVLFSSVDLGDGQWTDLQPGERPPSRKDFYRVVVDQVNIVMWSEIMGTLRYEFANFMKDIRLRKNEARTNSHPEEYTIEGRFLPAVKGNLLEAVNLGMSLVVDHFRDPDLRHTTNHFVIISPGTGIYDVDYDVLINTSKKMSFIDSTIDVICLSQPPLHVVPLFRYRDNHGKLNHCIPSWMDISFWNDSMQSVNQWMPRCKIYEIQMMGVMETETNAITIEPLTYKGVKKSILDAMNDHDAGIFSDARDNRVLSFSKSKKRYANEMNRTLTYGNAPGSERGTPVAPATVIQQVEVVPTTPNIMGVGGAKPVATAMSTLLNLAKGEEKIGFSSALNFMKRITSSSSTSNPSSPKMSDTTDESSSIPSLPRTQEIPTLITSRVTTGKPAFKEKRSKSKKDSTGSLKDISAKVGVTQNLWTEVQNPSKAVTSELLGMVSYGRWQFVFPPSVKRRAIKWTSLSSPASLPTLTPVFPTLGDFNQNFTFRIYDVILNTKETNENMTSFDLMREMIALRLTLGFQICVGENVKRVESKRKPGGDVNLLVCYISKQNYLGSRIYMSLGDEIHRMSCDYHGNVNVQVYRRSKDIFAPLMVDRSTGIEDYIPNVRTRYDEEFRPALIGTLNESPKTYNWNQLDQILAGYDDTMEENNRRFHRMKFVILPADVPQTSFQLANNGEKLTPEELRLEGLRLLISSIFRGAFKSSEEKKRIDGRGRKVEISPEISFYTGNLFAFLNEQADLYSVNGETNNTLFSRTLFDRTISCAEIAQTLQGEKGIQFVDRKWHLRTHANCFLGSEFVRWLIENFSDIDTREVAVDFGNHLMDEGLFKHVESRHKFLDGHYFYALNPEYVDKSNPTKIAEKTNWFGKKAETDKPNSENSSISDSVKSGGRTPLKMTPLLAPSTSIEDIKLADALAEEPEVKRVVLSRSLLYDLDPSGKSYKQELMTVHFDRVHNPDHCFHIRLEWLSTTSKLIEDTINKWGKHCDRYGLKLVETPWQELCTLPERNPFHSFVRLALALDPWTDPEFASDFLRPILRKNKYFYHIFLLESTGFLLDNRTAVFFKDDSFDVSYSWGKPKFKYAQFIHKTGAYIAELRDSGDLVLAPNNTHVARVNLNIGGSVSTQSGNAVNYYLDSQRVMLEFRAVCKNEAKLREIFKQAKSRLASTDDIDFALYDGNDL